MAGLRAIKVMYVDVCRASLKDKKPILPHADIVTIFSNVEFILSIHQDFWRALEKRLQSWNIESTIGDIFLAQLTSNLSNYEQFLNAHDAASELVKRHRARGDKTPFGELMRSAERDAVCQGQDLESLLIAPVQRIPRYILLLRDLLALTPRTHNDFHNLTEACGAVQAVANRINEHKRDVDSMKTLMELAKQIKFADGFM